MIRKIMVYYSPGLTTRVKLKVSTPEMSLIIRHCTGKLGAQLQ